MSMKKSILLAGFILGFIYNAQAQQLPPSKYWYPGKVVLDTEEELEGQVRYNFDNNLIQVKIGEKISTYSSTKFVNFEMEDADGNQRLFYVLPYGRNKNYTSPALFEVLAAGPRVTLLARELIIQETVHPDNNTYAGTDGYSRWRLEHDFYLLYPGSEIVNFEPRKNAIELVLKDKQRELEAYIRERKFDPQVKEDMVALIEYYNSLE